MAARMLARRLAGVLFLAAAVLAGVPAASKPAPAPSDDMAMGNARAKVTVVEYASIACPVCGRWYREVFPAFKAKYIDTGRVRFVTREMLVGGADEVSAAAAGFLLARCAGPVNYFKVTDAIYRTQEALFNDPKAALLNVAKSVGVDEPHLNACVQNEQSLKALNARVEANVRRANVHATPTFVVNGVSLEPGYHPLTDLDAAIAKARPGN